MTRRNRSLAMLAAAGLLGLALWGVTGREPESGDYAFVRQVLLTSDLGKREERVARWTAPVTVRFLNGDAKYREFLKTTIDELSRSVDGLSISVTDSRTAAVQVDFVTLDFLQDVLFEEGVGPLSRPPKGFFRTAWGRDWEVAQAVILVDRSLDETETRRTLLQELFHTLGLVNHSPTHPESAMYRNETGPSTATAVVPIDRRILRFLYGHLKPGDDAAAVRAAFDRYWESVPAD